MIKHLADASLGTIGGGTGLGPFSGGGDGISAISKLISTIIGVLTIAAGIWFLFNVLIAGFNWINAGGDKAKLQSSRDKLTNSFIGLIVVVASWSILALAGTFFNVDFTLSGGNPFQ